MFGLFLFEFGQKFILANNPPSLLYMAGWLGCSLIEAAWSERRKERAGQMTREGERGGFCQFWLVDSMAVSNNYVVAWTNH